MKTNLADLNSMNVHDLIVQQFQLSNDELVLALGLPEEEPVYRLTCDGPVQIHINGLIGYTDLSTAAATFQHPMITAKVEEDPDLQFLVDPKDIEAYRPIPYVYLELTASAVPTHLIIIAFAIELTRLDPSWYPPR